MPLCKILLAPLVKDTIPPVDVSEKPAEIIPVPATFVVSPTFSSIL